MFAVIFNAALFALASVKRFSLSLALDVEALDGDAPNAGGAFALVLRGEDKVKARSAAAMGAPRLVAMWERRVRVLTEGVDTLDAAIANAATAEPERAAAKVRRAATEKRLDVARKELSYAKYKLPACVWCHESAGGVDETVKDYKRFVLATSSDKAELELAAAQVIGFYDDRESADVDRFNAVAEPFRPILAVLISIFGPSVADSVDVGSFADCHKPKAARVAKSRTSKPSAAAVIAAGLVKIKADLAAMVAAGALTPDQAAAVYALQEKTYALAK
jgi:hypothetical protein